MRYFTLKSPPYVADVSLQSSKATRHRVIKHEEIEVIFIIKSIFPSKRIKPPLMMLPNAPLLLLELQVTVSEGSSYEGNSTYK
jgi:hypothetical protein